MCSTQQDNEAKALKLYEQAMKLNPEDNYSKEAEELLKNALKLNPDIPDACTALGYTLLQKGELKEGTEQFRTAVKLCDDGKPGNKGEALCGLSIAVRFGMQSKGDEANPLFNESIDVAKQAIKADTESGKCWYTLGMAYLSRFFHGRKYPKDLNDALGAFQFAEKKPKTPLADLHANRGTVFRFLASFHNARGDFEEALRLDPTFTSIQGQLVEIKKIYDLVHDILVKKNVAKSKLEQLPKDSTLLTELDQEKNPDKILHGVVIQGASLSNETPQLFVCADRNDSRFVLALYDVMANAVPEGAIVKIVAPRVAPFSWDGKLVHPLIVVDDLGKFSVNEKLIPSELRALPVIDSDDRKDQKSKQ